MQRPPRLPYARLFDAEILQRGLLQGSVLLIIVLAIFGLSLYRGMAADEARALTFTTLVLASIGLILTNRSWTRPALQTLRSPNPALWWVTGGAVVILALIIFLPVLSGLFSFGALHAVDVALCVFAGLIIFTLFEAFKLIRAPRL